MCRHLLATLLPSPDENAGFRPEVLRPSLSAGLPLTKISPDPYIVRTGGFLEGKRIRAGSFGVRVRHLLVPERVEIEIWREMVDYT